MRKEDLCINNFNVWKKIFIEHLYTKNLKYTQIKIVIK